MSEPAAFCVRCRALLDAGQGCECGDAERHVPLDADAASRIEDAILVTPDVDTGDLTTRALVGSVTVLGPIAVVFFLGYTFLRLNELAIAEAWPWILGVPYALLGVGWVGFLVWSAMEERKPYFSATGFVRPGADDGEEATVEAGRLDLAEIHQQRDPGRVVVRDAVIEEPLVLRRPGELITVPAGRVDVVVAPSRWRARTSALTRDWGALPADVFRAGVVRRARLRRGDRVRLVDGELDAAGREEATFRTAAEERRVWVPRRRRTRLVIVAES